MRNDHRVQAFKVFYSNVTGHLQALRTWHFKYKAGKEAAIHRLAGRIGRVVRMLNYCYFVFFKSACHFFIMTS